VLLLAFTALLAGLPACKPKSNKVRVAFISNNEYDFWKIAQAGTRKAAADFDVEVEFKMPSGGGSAEQQRRFIEDLLAKGIKGIAISPNNAADQTEFFGEVNAQVPLLMVDSDAADPAVRRCYVGTNNVEAGKAAGELLQEAVKDGGKLMIYVGRLDVANAVERRKGLVIALAGGEDKCKDELEQLKRSEYPISFGKFELLGTKTDTGKQEVCRAQVDDNLSKIKDLKCMVGLWAYNPPAMLEGVKAAKKIGEVTLVGFDENEETLQGIKDGAIHSTVVQNPYEFGYRTVKIMAALARGDESVLKGKDVQANHCIYVPHRKITKQNVEAFHAELRKLKGG
jgi:ribose transport system substrate-binding protein